MISAINVSLQYGKRVLFKDVNLKFVAGECYGIIGANGSGKSTFLKILGGEINPNKGEIVIEKRRRMSVLAQDQNAFNDMTAIECVIGGHEKLFKLLKEQETLYALGEDITDAQGIRLADIMNEFTALDGWEAEGNAASMLNGMKIPSDIQTKLMKDIDPKLKVKILLARALFGNPDILVMDEPTNNLDLAGVRWLENFLLDFKNTVIIVSHNRHFLNKVCTHICDVDYSQINMFVGNYDFWYETSQLILRQQKEANKKASDRAEELKSFIARFSANASKSKQATSRKKELEKLTIEDIKPSSRKYPYVNFEMERDLGNEVLAVENLTLDGFFKNVSFRLNKGERVAVLSENSQTASKFFDCLMGKIKPTSGTVTFGKTVNPSYLPSNNDSYFKGNKLSLVDWLKQYSTETHESFIRGWLGRMLFSGEEALKQVNVLSGGEKVRCMLAKTMLEKGNFLILDEPTNHLDLESITGLNDGMKKFKGVMMFATQDEEIMATVANRIMEINPSKFVDKMSTYGEYLG
ncbi:MAG: ATP-binding cassette domain-containing protein [Firmicutes bacterium]|nr:ATP-binding cassette domain-containing protein [Bacillota bacterium]